MTKSITLAVLVCVLIMGAAATSILARDAIPAAGASMSAVVTDSPISNRDAKADRLVVLASAAPPEDDLQPAARPQPAAVVPEPVRQALAYAAPSDVEPLKLAAPAAPAVAAEPAAKPKLPVAPAVAALRPEVQKAYALLSDGQIAGIKERLKLSPDQESYWPAVETALRAVAKKIHGTKQANIKPGVMPIDPDSDEVAQLKSAAMPLLWQLRDDQKDEVRKLARLLGMDRVASMI